MAGSSDLEVGLNRILGDEFTLQVGSQQEGNSTFFKKKILINKGTFSQDVGKVEEK